MSQMYAVHRHFMKKISLYQTIALLHRPYDICAWQILKEKYFQSNYYVYGVIIWTNQNVIIDFSINLFRLVIYIINDLLVSVSRGKCSEMTDLIATAGTDFRRWKLCSKLFFANVWEVTTFVPKYCFWTCNTK